ncbi:MAG: hypothetical protein ABIH42_08700, partial [Planctomycetota bacterium]
VVLVFYFLLKDMERPAKSNLIAAALFGGLSIFIRIHTVYLFLPAAYLFYRKYGPKFIINVRFLSYCVLTLIIPVAWFSYTYYATVNFDNIYTNMFVQMIYATNNNLSYYVQPDFYRTVMDYLSGICFTPLGFAAFVLGLLFMIKMKCKDKIFLYSWFFTIVLLIFTFPQKITDHNFYLLHMLPVGSIFAGVAVARVTKLDFFKERANRNIFYTVMVVGFLLFSFRYFAHPVMKNVPKNEGVLRAARAINEITDSDDLIIASRGEAGDLLYYCDRNGWSFSLAERDNLGDWIAINKWDKLSAEEQARRNEAFMDHIKHLEYLRENGAEYFVASYPPEFYENGVFAEYMMKNYKNISENTDEYLIFDLRKKK